MELRHLYMIANAINEEIRIKTIPKDAKADMEITVEVTPTTFYGIDKEFYYMTHNNSYEGFEHSKKLVTATIDGIKFNIMPKESENAT